MKLMDQRRSNVLLAVTSALLGFLLGAAVVTLDHRRRSTAPALPSPHDQHRDLTPTADAVDARVRRTAAHDRSRVDESIVLNIADLAPKFDETTMVAPPKRHHHHQ